MEMKSRISESEWVLMKILWNQAPLTAKEILEQLPQEIDWKENTVKTLLSRLVQKSVLDYEMSGRTYRYYPIVDEGNCVQAESKQFLNKVFGGMTKALVASFITNESLNKEEIDELKNLLDDKLK